MEDELLNFEAIEMARYQNMSFAKRVVLCSFTEILFQRKLLPDEAFKAVRLKGMKVFVLDAGHDDAYENLVKLSKICEEIENETVKTLRFVIYVSDNDKERVGEIFEMHLSYGKKITVSLTLGNTIEHFCYDSRTYKKDFHVFIMRLRQFCRMLNDLPDGSYGRYHVVYNSGKKMLYGCDYFTKIVRAPPVWKGPKQDICGIVGKFNGSEIGVRMSVGTLFGTGRTDSAALVEHLKEENWDEGGWDEQRENTQRRFGKGERSGATEFVSYNNILEVRGMEDEEFMETCGKEGTGDVDEEERGEYSWNDSAQRGSEIDTSIVSAMNEEANEKEGRMEMRRTRKRRMLEKDGGLTTMTDTQMDSDSGGEDAVMREMSAIEEAIAARKRRLMEMKSRMNGLEMKEEDYEKEDTVTKKSKGQDKTFRSYQPVDANVGEVDKSVKTNLRAVEEEIEEQLKLANDTSHVDKIDLQALAPKKVDWDLKRDVSAKLDKLERRTQAGIAHLIRERLGEGKTDLAEAVASAQSSNL